MVDGGSSGGTGGTIGGGGTSDGGGASGTPPASGSAAAINGTGVGAGTGKNQAPNSGGATGTPGGNSTPPADWSSSLNDESKGFVQNKGWKGAQDAVESYRNLEKLVGAPADQVLKLPKSDDQAGWDSVYTRLGRPASPDGYKIEVPKEGGDPEFAKWASGEFHKAGLSEKQGKGMVEAWNKFVDGKKTAGAEAIASKTVADQANLKKEWGAAYEQNIGLAKRAAREFGVDGKMLDAMDAAIGHAGTMKFFQKIGTGTGESSFVSGSGNSGMSGGIPTPAQAQASIQALRADPSFTKQYLAGDAVAKQRMEALHKYAYPES